MKKLGLLLVLCWVHGVWAATTNTTNPEHWFTGPLLAPAAKVVPPGHVNFEPYFFVTDNSGIYSHHGGRIKQPEVNVFSFAPDITVGLIKDFDFQIIFPYNVNWQHHHRSEHFSDFNLYLGYQACLEQPGTLLPTVRVTLQENVPAGNYQNFSPETATIDATGSGVYQTGLGLNTQKSFYWPDNRVLRSRLSLVYFWPASKTIHGFNAFGGGFGTAGQIKVGAHSAADLAFEYTLTKNWVPALDVVFYNQARDQFSGNRGLDRNGRQAKVGSLTQNQLSVAPALEYNFNAQLGIIGGIWFSVWGQDSSDFKSASIAINYYV